MKRTPRTLLALAFLVAAMAVAGAAAQSSDLAAPASQMASSHSDDANVAAAVQAVLDRYTDTIDRGDLNAWMALWAPGGVQMPPGTPMRVGLSAIRNGMAPALTDYDDVIQIHTLEITVAGDWAYARGTYTLDSRPKGYHVGTPDALTSVDGKFMTVLARDQQGSWKIYRDIFNSNVAAR